MTGLRVLQVCHHFLPRHRAGVEVYTDTVSRALQAKGCDVAVFTTDEAPARRPFSVSKELQDGLLVHVLAHPRVARTPDDSLGHPLAQRGFESVLDTFRPDIVHFQHLMYVGLGAALVARARGIPVVLTLHEYWLLCARGGQMRQADGTLCARADMETCARCLRDFPFGRTEVEARVARWCAGVRRFTGWDPFPHLKRLQERRRAGRGGAATPLADVGSLRAFLERRTKRVRAVADAVDRVLCPSRFLLEKFAGAGWDRDRLLHWPNGVRPLPGIERRGDPTGRPLRVGFMGSVTPWKGPDVFLAAVGLLPPLTVEAHLFGSMDARPGFAAEVQRLAKASGARVHGALAGDAVPEALAALDVLVVPSVWYENAPLVISEAFALGLPVVASRLGGMAEMVTDGKNGILFTPGDAADLARVLADLAAGRPALDDLRAGIPPPRTLDEDAADLLALYRELLPNSGLQGGANHG